jgi:predicted DNA-binding WGR domain protein
MTKKIQAHSTLLNCTEGSSDKYYVVTNITMEGKDKSLSVCFSGRNGKSPVTQRIVAAWNLDNLAEAERIIEKKRKKGYHIVDTDNVFDTDIRPVVNALLFNTTRFAASDDILRKVEQQFRNGVILGNGAFHQDDSVEPPEGFIVNNDPIPKRPSEKYSDWGMF